jgi:hypothetical protein
MAEIQMKRLHQVMAVLTDREARRKYDVSLQPATALPAARRPSEFVEPAPLPERFHVRPALVVWVGTTLSAVAAIVSFYFLAQASVENPPEALRSKPLEVIHPAPKPGPGPNLPEPASNVASRAHRSTEVAFDIEQAGVIRDLRRQLKESQAEYQDALLQIGRLQSQLTPAGISQKAGNRQPEPSAPAAQPKAPPDALSSLGGNGLGFTGNWLYVPSSVSDSASNHLYPPEYIELRAAERGGVIRGHYRGRYKVTDLAISPDVAFQFEGPVSGDAAQLPWTGPGGSKGQVLLKLAPDGGMQVRWTAHRLSRQLGLSSGVATLVRLRQ